MAPSAMPPMGKSDQRTMRPSRIPYHAEVGIAEGGVGKTEIPQHRQQEHRQEGDQQAVGEGTGQGTATTARWHCLNHPGRHATKKCGTTPGMMTVSPSR